MNDEQANGTFNSELQLLIDGKLPKNHIFHLGPPGAILQRTGFPSYGIELAASRLLEKAKDPAHPFALENAMNLVQSINEPVAVFSYGESAKAQNIIVELKENGRNFLAGIHFNQERRGTTVNDIRGFFPKDTYKWLNWITQEKLLYADIEKLQAVVNQQRTNSAEVAYRNLEPIDNLLQRNKNVKHFFMENSKRVKEKGSELWGRLQLPPRHNSELTTTILTKPDIVKRFLEKNEKISQTPAPYGEGKNNGKEKTVMSDMEQESEFDKRYNAQMDEKIKSRTGKDPGSMTPEERSDTAAAIEYEEADRQEDRIQEQQAYESAEKAREKQAFLAVIDRRAAIGHALKEGTLACLPGKDGYADTSPAVNIANGTHYHGASLLQLKEHQRENGFPSGEYVTLDALLKSGVKFRDPGAEELKRTITITFSEKNTATGEWKNEAVKLANVAQAADPEKVRAFAAKQLEQKEQNREDYLKEKFGDSYTPKERSGKKPGPEITCSSTEPEKYLGEYLAAVSLGGKFKATPEQGAEFKQKFGDSLWEKSITLSNGEKRTNPFKLSSICAKANEQCKEVVKHFHAEERKNSQEQTQTHGRSM